MQSGHVDIQHVLGAEGLGAEVAAVQELAGEVEQVAVVEHDQELGQLPLVGLDGPGVALACVHSAELCVHVNVHLMSAALGTVARVWAGAGLGGAGTTGAESHWNSC